MPCSIMSKSSKRYMDDIRGFTSAQPISRTRKSKNMLPILTKRRVQWLARSIGFIPRRRRKVHDDIKGIGDKADCASVPALVESVRVVLLSCQSTMEGLATLIPENQYWRWKDMWTNSMRSAVYSAVFCDFLINGTLLSLEATCEQLGSTVLLSHLTIDMSDQPCPSAVKSEWKDRFQLAVEDYLHGVITLVNELVSVAQQLSRKLSHSLYRSRVWRSTP